MSATTQNHRGDYLEEHIQTLSDDSIISVSSDSPGILVYPTDTLYALGCRADLAKDCAKIFTIKGRAEKKPLLLLADSIDMIRDFGGLIDLNLEKKLEEFWPGPLTVILPVKPGVNIKHLNQDTQTLAFRIPDNPLTIKLISYIGAMLVGTSANISNEVPPSSIDMVPEKILKACDHIFKQDQPLRGKPSTIVEINNHGKARLIRVGEIDFDRIQAFMD